MTAANSDIIADLRSDTVTRPTPEMRRAMMEAPLGDDVLGDEPSVRRLESKVADLLGHQAACFVPSGSMANQAAIRAHTEPGDEIICHRRSHVYDYEAGAFAAISGCSITFLNGPRGIFAASDIETAIRPDDHHFPRSRLLVIENTNNRGGGSVWSPESVRTATERARELGLRRHLDGARLWNASVAAGVEPREYARHFDSVSVCFSKGLGAPVGSAVAASHETIARVRRWRKMFGGAMRQSGILAGAAIHALDHHYERLAEDHANARLLAHAIDELPGLSIDAESVETNIIYFEVDPPLAPAQSLVDRLKERGVLVLATGPTTIRAVTHLDVPRDRVERAIEVLRDLIT